MKTLFKCVRCGKTFTTQKAFTIHAEVKREDGCLATVAVTLDEVKSDEPQTTD